VSDQEKVKRSTGFVGNSDTMQRALGMILEIAPIDISVLITGESGTGKEMVAKAIHKMSSRSPKPLVTVNCGAIPVGIIESELFGSKKGAYTGAAEDRKGYFEEADGGILFLDEIGEMPMETQVKLLRVLEQGEFMRVGDAKTRKVDVRIIAATNKILLNECGKGNFRKDLYYRLRTVSIEVPPLRQRFEDLDDLVERFALQFSRSNDIIYRGFTSDAIKILKQYDWPGNVRELKNFVERIIVLEKGNRISGELAIKHLAPEVEETSGQLPVPLGKSSEQAERELILQQLLFLRQDMRDIKSILAGNQIKTEKPPMGYLPTDEIMAEVPFHTIEGEKSNALKSESIGEVTLKEIEKETIKRTLQKFKNNRRKAAKALNMSERTLYRKINEYDLGKKNQTKK
tara:strand:+ start:28592 stop:29794 length:1203 start_codon:yes stop_codon:yes gene_type:complete